MVIEGEPNYYGTSTTTITNPSLIVEVLSKSTQNYDQGKSFIITAQSLNSKNIF
jgi:Uma2 family endonuclease